MAKKKLTAAQLARKQRKQERRKQAIANRPSHEQVPHFTRTFNAERWHSTAAHEIGHAVVAALFGLPIKQVECRPRRVEQGLLYGAVQHARERRRYVEVATTLPPSSAVLDAYAGCVGTLAAGLPESAAQQGLDGDRLNLYSAILRARIPRHDSLIDQKDKDAYKEWVRVNQQTLEEVELIADTSLRSVFKQEHRAFEQLVDELRFSPRGYLRGGRVAEVLLSVGTDVSGARRSLVTAAERIDELIGTTHPPNTTKGYGGWAKETVLATAADSRSARNAADRARRAKKRSVR